MTGQPSVCITLTSPLALNAFLLGHIRKLSCSLDVTVCVNVNESDVAVNLDGQADLIPIELQRKIAPFRDLLALGRLWNFYRTRKFQAVVTVTPKGGLLGMMAAWVYGPSMGDKERTGPRDPQVIRSSHNSKRNACSSRQRIAEGFSDWGRSGTRRQNICSWTGVYCGC